MTGIGSPSSSTFCVGKILDILKMFFLHLVNFFITPVHLLSAALLFIFPHSLSPRWRVECSSPHSLPVAVRFRIESHPERLCLSRNQVFFLVVTYVWHWGELRVLWSLSAEMEASLCSSHADPWHILLCAQKTRYYFTIACGPFTCCYGPSGMLGLEHGTVFCRFFWACRS